MKIHNIKKTFPVFHLSRTGNLFAAIALSLIILSISSLTGLSGLSVTPLLLDFTMDPGSSHQGTITVQNTGSKPLQVESQVKGFRTSKQGVAHFLSESAAQGYPYSGEKLLTLKPGEVVLGPGATKEFTYRISYPQNPDPFGGRYVGALFKASPVNQDEAETGGSSITVATRVGTLMLIRPSEEIVVGKEFQEFVVKPKIETFSTDLIYEGNKLLITTLLKNEGNIHIRKEGFSGKIKITDMHDNLVEELDMSAHNVLPETSYAFQELWTLPEQVKSGKKKEYTVTVTLKIQHPYGQTVQAKKTQQIRL